MEGQNSELEIKPIDKWNARILTLIVYGFVGWIVWGYIQKHIATLEAETLSNEMILANYGALIIAGIIMLCLLPLLARTFYQVMALNRMMIDAIWSILKSISNR